MRCYAYKPGTPAWDFRGPLHFSIANMSVRKLDRCTRGVPYSTINGGWSSSGPLRRIKERLGPLCLGTGN